MVVAGDSELVTFDCLTFVFRVMGLVKKSLPSFAPNEEKVRNTGIDGVSSICDLPELSQLIV